MDLLGGLNPFANKSDDDKPKRVVDPIGGSFGFFDEDSFEKESIPNPFAGLADSIDKAFDNSSNVLNPIFGDVKETTSILTDLLKEAFPVKGTLNFQEKKPFSSAQASVDKEKQQEAYRKKDFYQQIQISFAIRLRRRNLNHVGGHFLRRYCKMGESRVVVMIMMGNM